MASQEEGDAKAQRRQERKESQEATRKDLRKGHCGEPEKPGQKKARNRKNISSRLSDLAALREPILSFPEYPLQTRPVSGEEPRQFMKKVTPRRKDAKKEKEIESLAPAKN